MRPVGPGIDKIVLDLGKGFVVKFIMVIGEIAAAGLLPRDPSSTPELLKTII